MKQKKPILVILGNPPYNGFAGMAVDEERDLSDAYRDNPAGAAPRGAGAERPVRAFLPHGRTADRRKDRAGRRVPSSRTTPGWIACRVRGCGSGTWRPLTFIRVDNLNGDKYRTGKVAPDGSPDPSIFSTPDDPVGIQVGTAVATLVRKAEHAPAANVDFRDLWGQKKLAALTATAEAEPDALYVALKPVRPLGLPFAPLAVSPDWFDWPALPEIFPTSFPGVQTGRDAFLVDTDLDRLKSRVAEYFDAGLPHDEVARRYPRVMQDTGRFDARATRDALLQRGGPLTEGFVRFTYRPFDTRWLYWEAETKLLDEKRAEYKPHVFTGNLWLTAAQHLRQGATEPQAVFTGLLGSRHLIERGSNLFSAWLSEDTIEPIASNARRPNLSPAAPALPGTSRVGR